MNLTSVRGRSNSERTASLINERCWSESELMVTVTSLCKVSVASYVMRRTSECTLLNSRLSASSFCCSYVDGPVDMARDSRTGVLCIYSPSANLIANLPHAYASGGSRRKFASKMALATPLGRMCASTAAFLTPSRAHCARPVTASIVQARFASNLGPRRTKYRKAQKGRVPFPTGGSTKGTTVTQGVYGLRTLDPCRISATQLSAAETVLKRKLKVVRGSQVFMRVFPDIPVCVKGNETRMGKGKGSFEFWACRFVIQTCASSHHQSASGQSAF